MLKDEKKPGSWKVGLSVSLGILVALVAIVLSMPFPDLQWDEIVVPNAIEYMEKVMGVVWDDDSSSSSSITITKKDKQQPLRGMYIVVTGATSGIGLGLTRKLCLLGATVVAMGRSSSKLHELQQEYPQNIETVLADFSDLDSIAAASQYMIERYERLDILVNNAGIHPGLGQVSVSKQGYDLTFAGTMKVGNLVEKGCVDCNNHHLSQRVVSICSVCGDDNNYNKNSQLSISFPLD